MLRERVSPRSRRLVPWRALLLVLLLFTLLAVIAGWDVIVPWKESWNPQHILERTRSWADSWLVLGGFFGLYVFGNFFFLPIPLITLAAAAVFPPWKAIPCGLAGSLTAASLAYALGRLIDIERWPRLLQKKALAFRRQVAARELWAVVLLRLAPTPPFTVTSLLAGSWRLPWGAYALGSLIGVSPQIVLINIFGMQLVELLEKPGISAFLLLLFAGLLYALLQRRIAHDPPQVLDSAAQPKVSHVP